jgi:Ca2+-binding EF-hand superfamily protein
MDFQKAIQNLTDILIDEEKFSEINKSIFDAIDTDNSGSLEKEEVETFVKGLLKGIHSGDGDGQADLQERHKIVFSVLDDNESGEITLDELGKFLRELFKEQIKQLQEGVEKQKYNRAVAGDQGYEMSTNTMK